MIQDLHKHLDVYGDFDDDTFYNIRTFKKIADASRASGAREGSQPCGSSCRTVSSDDQPRDGTVTDGKS